MKVLIATALSLFPPVADARTSTPRYASCDLAVQREAKGHVGGSVRDAGQAHIAARSDVLKVDIAAARRSHRLSAAVARTLRGRVDAVRRQTDVFASEQGFLSAAERASYDRELDSISGPVCRR